MAKPQFDDPAVRGNPFKTDHAVIPEQYIGTWATTRSNCTRNSASTSRILFQRKEVDGSPIASVWAYSDYPAIIVKFDQRGQKGTVWHLDISDDEMALLVQDGSNAKPRRMVRCPVRLPRDPDAEAARKNRALACRNRDPDAFLDGFFASPSALADKIAIIRGDGPAQVRDGKYYQLPPIKFAPHAAYFEYGPQHVALLKFQTVPLADGGFRIDWAQEPREDDGTIYEYPPDYGYAEGIRGRLTFKWVSGCWKLASDEVRWTDWPDELAASTPGPQ